MASSPFPFPPTVNHNGRHLATPPNYNSLVVSSIISIPSCSSHSSKFNINRSFPTTRNFKLGRCLAASSPSEPPSDKDPPLESGATSKDTLQIFFAVLFWMSLFFWSCAWDGGNRGKPKKGPSFRK